MTHSTPRASGFSLLEILIATIIIAGLVAVSIPNALAARIRGNDNTAQMIIASIAAEQEAYKSENNTYWPKALNEAGEREHTWDPDDTDTPLPGIDFIPNLKPTNDYNVYFMSTDAYGNERYCIAVQHARGQSNAWHWTSGSVGEYESVDRETITSFETDMAATCASELNY